VSDRKGIWVVKRVASVLESSVSEELEKETHTHLMAPFPIAFSALTLLVGW